MWENGSGKNLITKTSWFQGGFWIILPVKFFDCPVIFLPEICITACEQKPAFALWCWSNQQDRRMCSISLPVHVTWPCRLIFTAPWLQTICSTDNNNNNTAAAIIWPTCVVSTFEILVNHLQPVSDRDGSRWEECESVCAAVSHQLWMFSVRLTHPEQQTWTDTTH